MSQEIAKVTDTELSSYLATAAPNLTDAERNQFFSIAKAFELNPFKREIYCIAYGQGQYRKLSIITGYEVYLKRAERTGKMDGYEVTTEGEGRNLKAIVTIYRKDWSKPFKHEVYFPEYSQDNQIWKTKPITMIKKVAIAQAFRLCFPDEFGGMPYTSDELPDNMTTPIPTAHEVVEAPQLPDSELKGLRGKTNTSLQKKTTTDEMDAFAVQFSSLTSLKEKIWQAKTGHNDAETFQMLLDSHKQRVAQQEFRISPEGIREWIQKLNECQSVTELQHFESAYKSNAYLQKNEAEDALSAKMIELGYLNEE